MVDCFGKGELIAIRIGDRHRLPFCAGGPFAHVDPQTSQVARPDNFRPGGKSAARAEGDSGGAGDEFIARLG
jgi:hypothetical protein